MGAAVVPDCPPVLPACIPGQILENTASRFFEEIAEQASQAAADMLKTLVTGWLAIPTPAVSQESGVVKHLQAYTNWAVAAIAVGSVLVAAIKLAIDRNGREAGTLGKNLALLVVIAGAGVPAVRLLTEIGDAYANWILSASANGDLGKRLLLLAPSTAAASTTGLSSLAVTGISVMVFLSTMVQLLLLLARNAGLVLLAGLLPVAAAVGGSVRSRYLTWLLALVLYKPAAATIYAAVFWLGGEGKSLTDLLTGLVMFCMAIVALPALLRLIAPAVSVLSSGGSGGVAVAAASGAGQIASGALRLSGTSSGGGAGASGGNGPRGGPGQPGGAGPSVPSPRPSGGGTGSAGTSGSGTAGAATSAAGTSAGTAGAGAGAATSGGAAGAGAAAAGPVGLAAAAGVAAAKAGPTAVRKVGGTASGAVDGEGS
ncbi:hypothetical protein ACFWRG_19925 [Micromonospora tulbaghiae]|uniref:hypothetical protein n=1 Tax=Micromonospora tulbaghiae TaxID=479978 RepID=UPI00365DFAFF